MVKHEDLFWWFKGRFPVIREATPSHVCAKEICHVNTRSQHANMNFYCDNCLLVFSAMTGKLA